MKNKIKNTVIVTFSITLILIMLVGATYAYFTAQAGGTTTRNISVTSNTTDNLAFQISNDISFTVTQATFTENAGNRDGYATATAILTPNNNTGAATMNYYLYLNITSNPTVYSEENTNEDAELLLQVFNGNNQLVTLTGLGSQVTVEDGLGNNLTGYDITGIEGIQTLLDNHEISASNNQATTETWRVVITLVNYDFNQNDNTGKTITGEVIIQRTPLSLPFNGTGIIYAINTNLVEEGYHYLNGGIDYEQHSQPGLDDFETSYTSYINQNLTAYCHARSNQDDCVSYNWNSIYYYSNYDECVNGISDMTGYGASDTNYICKETSPIYYPFLKYTVQNEYIEDVAVCVVYNNNEVCINEPFIPEDYPGWYSHEDEDDLSDYIEGLFGVTPMNCEVHNAESNIGCTIDEEIYIDIDQDNVRISNGRFSCYVSEMYDYDSRLAFCYDESY